jgi:hypothetical protein
VAHPVGLHWVLFDDDREIGRKTYIGYDDMGNPRGAHVEQEIDAIVAANAEAEKATHGVRFGEWNRAASVPLTFMEKTGLDQAIDAGDRRYLSKVLNDSDFSKLRTSRGKV